MLTQVVTIIVIRLITGRCRVRTSTQSIISSRACCVSGPAAACAPGMDENAAERFNPPARCVKILDI